MTTQSAEFRKATEESRNLKAKPTNDELLELYANYKQGTGEKFADATQPGAFNFKEKYKYNAWKGVAEKNITPQAAQSDYVKLVNTLKEKYGWTG